MLVYAGVYSFSFSQTSTARGTPRMQCGQVSKYKHKSNSSSSSSSSSISSSSSSISISSAGKKDQIKPVVSETDDAVASSKGPPRGNMASSNEVHMAVYGGV